MNKKLLLPVLGVLSATAASAQIQERPNILWVMAEDMGQDLECYGMQAVKTPILNKMAKEGVQYNAACVTNPISSPSRSAMMTGVHQVVTNSHNHRSNRDTPIDPQFKPFTYYLRESGYTCILGNHSVMNKGRKTDCNFKHTATGPWDGVKNFGLFDKLDDITPADQPFFAQVQLIVTHRGDWWKEVTAKSKHPVNPKDVVLPEFMADHSQIRNEWASYLDQVEHMDGEMGMLLDELEAKGMLDNTIIFFIGDNGRCDIRGKGYLYEPGIKIPMIAWGKGIKATQVNEIVSTLDITATVLDLAGVEIPDYYQGKPLFNKKNGKSLSVDRDYSYTARDIWDEVNECMRGVETDKYKYIRNYMPEQGWDMHQNYLDFHRPAVHVMRTLKEEGKLNEKELLFFADSKPKEELYDIINDPYELNNLAENPKYLKVLKKHREIMDEWQANNDDKGLKDRDNRNPEPKTGVWEYMIENYPEELEYLKAGNIGENFKKLSAETKAAQKANKKK